MFGVEFPFVGNHIPTAVIPLVKRFHLGVLDDGRATFFGSARVGMHGSCGIDIALAVTPESAKNTRHIHDGTFLFNVLGGHQVAVLDPNGLENPIGGLQPFPPGRR